MFVSLCWIGISMTEKLPGEYEQKMTAAAFKKVIHGEWLGQTMEEDGLAVYGWIVGNLYIEILDVDTRFGMLVKLEIGVKDPATGEKLSCVTLPWQHSGGSIDVVNPPEGAFVVGQRIRIYNE